MGGTLAKKKGLADKMDQDDEELLENKEMFMTVKDFQDRMVVLPTEFGRKKKGASGMHQDVEEEGPVEEEEEEEGVDEVEEEEGVEDEGEEEGEEGEEEGGEDTNFCNRECYEFNTKKGPELDDRCCKHCRRYLTLQCPHLSDFSDELDEADVD